MPKSNKSDLKIVRIEDKNAPQFPAVPHKILPQHPFSMLMVAAKGGGKTNFLCNLITRQYKGYFNRIVVCSPTIENDDKWEIVKDMKGLVAENKKLDSLLEGRATHKKKWKIVFKNKMDEEQKPDENKFDGRIDEEDMFTSQKDIFPIIEHQQNTIEFLKDHDHKKDFRIILDRVLIIFDDQAGLFKMSSGSNPLVNYFLKHRHYSTSVIFVTQAYKAIPRSIRVNMSCLILFEIPNQSELDQIYEEYNAKLNYDQWMELYWYCVEDEPYSFLYYNTHFEATQRFFKRFDTRFIVEKKLQGSSDRKIIEQKV